MENLAEKLNKEPREVRERLKFIAHLAKEFNFPVYVVGGFVRDLILDIDDFDLDIVVEGDAIGLARELSLRLNADFIKHKRFGTATVVTQDAVKLDLATAREEDYEQPASLPRVRSGSIRDDLKRRDFSINAMAVDISEGGFGRLVDFFKGREDLRNKRLRVLHNKSFIDDPTRILRAIRFEQRFDFKIDRPTLRLIQEARKKEMLEKVHPHRLRDELILILKEPDPTKGIRRISKLYGFKFLQRDLHIDSQTFILLKQINGIYAWFKDNFSHKHRPKVERWLLYLMVLLENLDEHRLGLTLREFAFHKNDLKKIISFKADAAKAIAKLKGASSPSSVQRILSWLSYEVLLLLLLKTEDEELKKKIRDFLFVYSQIRTHLSGDELKELGMLPGPDFKKILKQLLYAKLDGKFTTKEEELCYLKTLISRIDTSTTLSINPEQTPGFSLGCVERVD